MTRGNQEGSHRKRRLRCEGKRWENALSNIKDVLDKRVKKLVVSWWTLTEGYDCFYEELQVRSMVLIGEDAHLHFGKGYSTRTRYDQI